MKKVTFMLLISIFTFSCSNETDEVAENDNNTNVTEETKQELKEAIELQQEAETLEQDLDAFLDSLEN